MPRAGAIRKTGFRQLSIYGRVGGIFWIMVHLICIPLAGADSLPMQIEKKILRLIDSNAVETAISGHDCRQADGYHVYLIDNFDQTIQILPGLQTSHGNLICKMLASGRKDIRVTPLNTGLSQGLARVIQALVNGACIDLVLSATPGSNYTYSQISSLFETPVHLDQTNILENRDRLKQLIVDIAVHGFPSVRWLERADINSSKLRNDAIKLLFIETLGRFNVPVVLPYGNIDTRYRGDIRHVNLMSLSENARVFSALDRNNKRIRGYPYSPLSAGEVKAEYRVTECPVPGRPFQTRVDVNEDGWFDYVVEHKTIQFPDDSINGPIDIPAKSPCRKQGWIIGTSFIVPHMVKQMLPLKK